MNKDLLVKLVKEFWKRNERQSKVQKKIGSKILLIAANVQGNIFTFDSLL